MRKILTLLAATAVAGVAAASGAQAQALRPAMPAVEESGVTNVQWRRGWGPGPGPGWGPRPGWGPGPYYYRGGCGWGGCNNNGAAVAAGIIGGLALGAAAASIAQANQPPAVVYAPPPGVNPNWIAYCSAKYRSFDPATGTYLGYDGLRHPCQ